MRRLYILKQLASRQSGQAGPCTTPSRWRSTSSAKGATFPWSRSSPTWWSACGASGGRRGPGTTATRPEDTIALFEHEYRVELKPEAWQALSRNVMACLRNFFRLPLVATIRKTSPEHWSIEHWSEGLRLRGRPRSGSRPTSASGRTDGRLALVDWKTGGSNPDGTAFQLGCYALYARGVLGVTAGPGRSVRGEPARAAGDALRWSDERLEAIKEQLRLSIRSMKAYLADPAANVAVIADFERTEELRICRWCSFRAVCRPELQGF